MRRSGPAGAAGSRLVERVWVTSSPHVLPRVWRGALAGSVEVFPGSDPYSCCQSAYVVFEFSTDFECRTPDVPGEPVVVGESGAVEASLPRLDFPGRIRQSEPRPHRLLMPNWLVPKSPVTQIEICSRGNAAESGVERREWDSNPRRLAPHSFSRAAHLSALPSLQARHARGDPSGPRAPTGVTSRPTRPAPATPASWVVRDSYFWYYLLSEAL